MATFQKLALTPDTTEGNGTGILIGGPAATNRTNIHKGSTTTTVRDEVWLYAQNTDTTAREVTIEFGGTSAGFLIVQTIPAKSGLVLMVPGLILRGAATALQISAWATANSVVNIHGYVNRIS